MILLFFYSLLILIKFCYIKRAKVKFLSKHTFYKNRAEVLTVTVVLRSWILLLHIDARFSGHSFFFIPRTTTTTTTFATTITITITTTSYVSVPTIPTTTTTLMVTPIYAPLLFHLFLETQKLQILFLCQTIPIWRLLLLAVNKLMPLPISKFCAIPLLLLSICMYFIVFMPSCSNYC